MKKHRLFFLLVSIACIVQVRAQQQPVFSIDYRPADQVTNRIAYFKPAGNLFVGDCIPFYHNNTYYLYWLLDSAHHKALNGLGGHQWALSTSTDLVNWTHYPVALGIDEDWEKSICTGSVVKKGDTFYAFYATRLVDSAGKKYEQLSYATSKDGIKFAKQRPNPFYSAPDGYSPRHFRDPKVFLDDKGAFHLFVTSALTDAEFYQAGTLAHLVSADGKSWKVLPPVLTGLETVPECPDYFFWKGWYYLVYSNHSETFYVMSRQPNGPWQYPVQQTLREEWSNVVKVAPFHNDRRIAASWIPGRKDNKDNGTDQFGGNMVFRELFQNPDGTLRAAFVKEMAPPVLPAIPWKTKGSDTAIKHFSNGFLIDAQKGPAATVVEDIPLNARIFLEIDASAAASNYGLILRSAQKGKAGYRLDFSSQEAQVRLGNTMIQSVPGINGKFTLDVIMTGDIIDVSVNKQRCIINRTPEQNGTDCWFYNSYGRLKINSLTIYPLK